MEAAIQAEKERHARELHDLETRLKESFVMVGYNYCILNVDLNIKFFSMDEVELKFLSQCPKVNRISERE